MILLLCSHPKGVVIIDLTLAALNDFNVKMADIENAYLTAPITEKIWTVLFQSLEMAQESGHSLCGRFMV
jgi:hypothetical protein